MAVDEDMIVRVASLARLRLDGETVPKLAAELNRVLDWVSQLQTVDTEGVEPMTSVVAEAPVWRDDVVDDGNIADAVLANAPDASHGFFGVPKVIE